jgi:hypothetical protein
MLALNPSCVIRVVPLAENGTVFGTTNAGTRRRAVAPFALSMYSETVVCGIFPFPSSGIFPYPSKVIAHWLVLKQGCEPSFAGLAHAVAHVVAFAGDVLARDAHRPCRTSARVCAPTVGIVLRHAVVAVVLSSVVVSALY